MSVSTKEVKLLLASPTSRVRRQPPASEQPSAEPERINQPHRCGARTRNQRRCQSSPVRGKTRCRMHGGAAGSGAPAGNRNAVTNGRYTAEAIALRREVRALVRQNRRVIESRGGEPNRTLPPSGSGARRSSGAE